MAINLPRLAVDGQIYSSGDANAPTYVYRASSKTWQISGITSQAPTGDAISTVITATANQTVFTASYTPGCVDVYRNGLRVPSASMTATDGSTITLASPAQNGDVVEIVAWNVRGVLPPGGAYGFSVQYSSGNVTSISNVPPGWTVTITGTNTIQIVHGMGHQPVVASAWATESDGTTRAFRMFGGAMSLTCQTASEATTTVMTGVSATATGAGQNTSATFQLMF